MKFSIAMCTYNGAAYLKQQLTSIAAQTRIPDELVICDDGSTDETAAILKSFAVKTTIPGRLEFNQANLGSNKNFAQAISLCSGDLIALCDQDDIWHPEKLARIEAIFAERADVGLVFTNGDVIDENSQPVNYTLWQGVGFSSESQAKIKAGRAFTTLTVRPAVTGAAMAFRRHFSSLILPIPDDPKFVHDEWIALLIAATADLAMIDEPLMKYRRHSHQQIGVAAPGPEPAEGIVSQMRQGIRRENPFAFEIKRLQAVSDRLSSNRQDFPCESALHLLNDRVAHLSARARISQRGLKSVLSVLRELLTLRYHRYSRGTYSAIKDLQAIAFRAPTRSREKLL